MKCDVCGGQMTPMISSWFCPRDCDRRPPIAITPPTQDDVVGRMTLRLHELAIEHGYTYAPYRVVVKPIPPLEEMKGFRPRVGIVKRYSQSRLRPDFFGIVRFQDLPKEKP